jgi:hypothetical protein
MLGAIGRQKFTKALVVSTGVSVEEVDVSHAASSSGSRYSPLRLVRLALHVVAGFWPQPVQWIGVSLGLICSLAAAALGVYGLVYWIVNANFPGPLFAGAGIVLVLGIQGFVLALIGSLWDGSSGTSKAGRCTRSRRNCEQESSGDRRGGIHLVELHPAPARRDAVRGRHA